MDQSHLLWSHAKACERYPAVGGGGDDDDVAIHEVVVIAGSVPFCHLCCCYPLAAGAFERS